VRACEESVTYRSLAGSVLPVSRRFISIEPHVVFRRLGDRMILVQLRTNQIFDLNETSARLWELLSVDGDVAAAETGLTAEYDVDPDQLHDEVERMLAFLTAERLIGETTGG
jgi:Coenzyme PQQ synthesis protein D (PqqD)